MERVGFTGTISEFFNFMRTSPKFRISSADELRQGYLAIEKRVNAAVPALFSEVPKAKLDVQPIPAHTEKTAGDAFYVEGPPDGSRPGTFFFNSYDLPSRPTYPMEDLFLHEATPGHHFQVNLAQENRLLPNFQRFGSSAAFGEGWALYAETLGEELGLYKDPYQMYGYLESNLWRALRLVVDTGIHAKNWSEKQAIEYMLANSGRSRHYVTNEVRRYIGDPGQALAYKIGQMKFRELRTRAETSLGSRFDVRKFHTQVLNSGAIPLTVLEAKIDRWIQSEAAAANLSRSSSGFESSAPRVNALPNGRSMQPSAAQ
jgi:uncharacterized protein (DUF885 family)